MDGDFALRVRGSGADLQAFVDALRFAVSAPVKPSLTTRPLNQRLDGMGGHGAIWGYGPACHGAIGNALVINGDEVVYGGYEML